MYECRIKSDSEDQNKQKTVHTENIHFFAIWSFRKFFRVCLRKWLDVATKFDRSLISVTKYSGDDLVQTYCSEP